MGASQWQAFSPYFPRVRTAPGDGSLPAADTAIRHGPHAGRVERLSIVVPIGIIVAVAIVCVLMAVLGSARRADEVAVETERQLISRALSNHAQRVLREVETVVLSDAAYRKIRIDFDADWVKVYADQRLQSWFEHDLVFVLDPSDRLLYASLGSRGSDPSWFNSVRPDLLPVLDGLRNRDGRGANVTTSPDPAQAQSTPKQHYRAAGLQMFLDRPAIVAAVAIAGEGETPADLAARAPTLVSVKWLDADVLNEIATLLQLRNLHMFEGPAPAPDHQDRKSTPRESRQH